MQTGSVGWSGESTSSHRTSLCVSRGLLALDLARGGSGRFANPQSKELAPLLRQSPETLPFPPRIIYTSSCTAEYSSLKPNPLEDHQLLSYGYPDNSSVYKASKYCGDLVMIQLDRQFAKAASEGEREIRVFTADPGVVATNIAGSTFGPWVFYRKFMQFMNFLIFFLVRPSLPSMR